MEQASHLPIDEPPLPHAEAAIAEQFRILTKPLDQLPPISDKSLDRGEFWTRRKLRPDAKGGNFNNVPVLGLRMDYRDGQAVVTVPSAEYVNAMVGQYNPGGFRFLETDSNGIAKRNEFLELLSNKLFPLSKDRVSPTTGIEDEYRLFRQRVHGEPYTFFNGVAKLSVYEHDRIDHLGLAILPASEADKIAACASSALNEAIPENRKNISGFMDRLLDLISEYATIDANDGAMDDYREFVWHNIEQRACKIEEYIRTTEPIGSRDQKSYTVDWKLLESARAGINREVFDKKISDMQALVPRFEASQLAAA